MWRCELENFLRSFAARWQSTGTARHSDGRLSGWSEGSFRARRDDAGGSRVQACISRVGFLRHLEAHMMTFNNKKAKMLKTEPVASSLASSGLPVFFVCVSLLAVLTGCTQLDSSSEPPAITADLFEHHYIADDMPTAPGWGYGVASQADFDQDDDLDFAFGVRGDSVYWFEHESSENWTRHTVGPLPIRTLGGAAMDVDGDGWKDIVIGGYWYRNPQNPQVSRFEIYRYDDTIENEIHDVVTADVSGDGNLDVAVLGDAEGAYWYEVPAEPTADENWPRHTITMDVLEGNDAIHSGFFPKGIGDLDGDGDADVVLPDRWMENRSNGTEWIERSLPFGKRGPWGLSSRSWITDLDEDGDNDIVVVDSDQTDSRVAWLENDGASSPSFTAHMLPQEATGTRGSFHSLSVADFNGDGRPDIFAVEQEDQSIFPEGAGPRWYIWENLAEDEIRFEERVIYDDSLGGHDAIVGDVDGDGDPDITSKIWKIWSGNANNGNVHVDYLENELE